MSKLYLYNNNLYIYNKCFGEIFNSKPSYFKFNLINKKLEFFELENMTGANLSYFQPMRVFHFYKDYMIFADITKYQIKLLNIKKNENYELKRSDIISNSKELNAEIDNFKSLDKFRQISGKFLKMEFLQFVDFINDSTIFVCWQNKNQKFVYDIWVKENNNFELKTMDLTFLPEDKSLQKLNFMINPFNRYKFFDNQLVIFSTCPLDFNKQEIYKNYNYKEYLNLNNDFYKDNDIQYSIKLYNLK